MNVPLGSDHFHQACPIGPLVTNIQFSCLKIVVLYLEKVFKTLRGLRKTEGDLLGLRGAEDLYEGGSGALQGCSRIYLATGLDCATLG